MDKAKEAKVKFQIGLRFEEMRREIGLTQQQLADELEMSNTTIAQIEKGRNYPQAHALIGLSKLFNVNLNWLLMGKGKMFL